MRIRTKRGWLLRKGEWVSMPGYKLKPSDGRKLNLFINEHRGMMEKLNVKMKDVKENTIAYSFSPMGLL